MRFFRNLKIKKSRVLAGVITASMLFSSVPTVTLLANDEQADDPNIIGTTSFETVIEEEEPVESTEAVVDENVTSIPADETEPTEVVTEPSEEPPIETTVEVIEPSEDETVPSEETTVPTEETTIPTEETTVPTTEETTTEPVEETTTEPIEPERWANMVYVESQDEFIESIANLPDSNRLIIITDDNIDNAFQIKSGVAFDGAYVVAVANQSELDEAVAFLNANGIDYARDGQIAINGSVSYSYSYAQRDANGMRVAVIDTGSNNADEIYSVIGEDGSDANGHGTQMCKIVKASGATVISIQAIGSNGKGQITDVYNAIQLANTLDVDYILMSISTRDVGSYSVFKDLVSETISSGTKVVASAGNNNRDASLYMPANISGVITVGALNEDLTKLDVSNYGSVVDFYVVASSTSEAAAKYIALEGTDAIYSDYQESPIVSIPDDNDVFIDVDEDGNFFICAWGSAHYNYGLTFTLPAGTTLVGKEGTYTEEGTCSFTDDPNNGGAGWITSCTPNSTTGLGFNLQNIINSYGRIAIECGAHNSLDSSSQRALAISSGTREYKVEYRVTKSGNTYSLEGDIYLCTSGSKDGWRNRSWSSITGTWSARLVDWNSNVYFYDITVSYGPSGSSANHHTVTRTRVSMPAGNSSARSGYLKSEIAAVVSDALNNGYSGYRGGSAPNYSTKPTSSAVTVSGSIGSSGTSNGSFSLSSSYQGTGQTQVYRQQVLASETRALKGDMISIHRYSKRGTSFTYSIAYRGNGATPAASAQTYPGTWPSMPGSVSNGTITFSGEYELGWYYIPLNLDSGAIYVHLWDDNGTVKKTVFYTPSGAYANQEQLQTGTCPYSYTVNDPHNATSLLQALRYNSYAAVFPTNLTNTHSVDVNNKGITLTNTTFCIEPYAPYTQTPGSWSNYRSVSDAMGTSLRSLLGNTPMDRIDGSTDNAKALNLCKILFYSGYTNAQKQEYLWYVMNYQASSAGYLSVPTYTATEVAKGNSASIFSNVTYNGASISSGYKIDLANTNNTVIIKTHNNNITTTNFELVITGDGENIDGRINNTTHDIELDIDPDITAAQIRNTTITIKTKDSARVNANGAPATSVEYYAFSVANNNNSQQTRFTGYYYLELPYYTASFNVKLDTHQDIKIKKASSNPSVTNGNSCYDLAGTTYEIYSTVTDAQNKTNRLGVFTVDSNGNVNNVFTIRDFSRNYYIREITAGKGYLLDDTIYTVTIGANPSVTPTVNNGASVSKDGDTYVINLTDDPTDDPIQISIQKVDASGQPVNTMKPYGAKFRLEVYAEEIGLTEADANTNKRQALANHAPEVVYEFTLNTDKVDIDCNYLKTLTAVGGSNPNYIKNLNIDDLPIGTYRIYEIDAPEGYDISELVLRYRIYQPSNGSVAIHASVVEGTNQYSWQPFTHTGDAWQLKETPTMGYYSLVKTMQDDAIMDNISGQFNYEVRIGNETIATGVSQGKGANVLWTYKTHIIDIRDGSTDLYGTTTEVLQLAVYQNDGTTKINYTVLEYIPNIVYGNTTLGYSTTTPTGWTKGNGVYYHTFTLQESESYDDVRYRDTITNNFEYANIAITKNIPANDEFDRTKVTFNLYSGDTTGTLIAKGTVDSNGNINFKKVATSGYGVKQGNTDYINSVNGVTHLPLGQYTIEEVWDRYYINSLDPDLQAKIEIPVENLSNGWTRVDTTTQVKYYYGFTLATDEETQNVGSSNKDYAVINDEQYQYFRLSKQVTVAGDVGDVYYEVYYINPDNQNRVLVAKAKVENLGQANTNYWATFYEFTGTHKEATVGGQTVDQIKLPVGTYEVREIVPETTYVRQDGSTTTIPYTYKAPVDGNGQPWTIHFKDTLHADYFYRNFNITDNETVSLSPVTVNTRIEANLEIRKMNDGNTDKIPDADFEFEIYYRGNGDEPENIGVWDEQYYLDTVIVHTVKGSGKAAISKLPEGWYEIREVNAPNWKINWQGQGTVTGDGTKIVRADSELLTKAVIDISDDILLFGDVINGVLAMNTISITPEIFKLDRWDRAIVRDARHTPDNLHLTFFLYDDANGNGVLDDDEAEQWRASSDLDDDGKATFSNIPCGNYIIREVATINGYYLTAKDIAFVVDEPVAPTFYMDNQPYTQPVKVTKLDNETNEPLSGAEFDVYVDVNGNGKYDAGTDVIATAWVDGNDNKLIDDGELVPIEITESATEPGVYYSNGELHWNDGDTFGKQYILVETKAPDNYFFVMEDGSFSANNTEIAFVINAEDTTAPEFVVKTSEFTIKNQTGTVIVYKIDKDGNFLSGCEFKIYTDEECTHEFATLVEKTDEKKYEYKGLGLGTYYIVETDAPDNYETDPNVYEFSITTTEVHPVIDNTEWIAQNEYTGVAGKFMNYVDVKTNLTDKETQEHIATIDDTITLVDVVAYKGLHVGEEYELKGYLYDTKTGEKYLDKNGEPVTATRTFTPETSVGTVELEFTFDYAYDVVTTVAYEYIYRDGKLVGSHTDITDLDQQVKFPSIHTTLVDTITEDHVAQQRGEMTLVDTVAYENLLVGKNYKMTGVLMIKGTGEPLLDADGNEITSFTTFTPETENGTVDVTFTFEASTVKDITLVAFETLTIIKADTTEKKVVDHKDINDVDQTVNVPEIRTTFYDVDLADAPEMAKQNKTVDLTDTVAYTNITPNLTYTLFARVMVKETGEPFKDAEGNDIVKSVTFTPTSENGTVDVVFEDIDTTLVAGKTLVCFETLSYKNIDLVIHADLEDEDQTVHVPEIHTTAVSDKTGEHVMPEDEEVTVVDTVAYENLIVGKEYRIEGKLVNQETGKDLVDAEGNVVTGETVFTPETPNGTVDVVFTFDATLLRGTTYVVFEDLYYNTVKVVAHADIEDEEQTIDFPEIHTTLLDEVTDDHVAQQRGKITLIDTVAYTHLTVGNEYVMHGTLMNAETGEPMLDSNGNKITAEKKFTPDEKDGFVEIVFTFDAELLTGETTVAFEELTRKDITVATHNDLTDRDQTVDIPEIHTTFFDKNLAEVEDFDQTVVGKEVKLTDTVAYENLTLLDKDGNKIEYTLRGTVMIKETNEPLTDADGNIVEFTKTFVPTESTGTVDVEFTVDTTELQGKTLVAFETLSYKGIDLVIHADIEDEAQTVHVPEIKTKATDKVDGDNIIDGAKTEQTIVDTVSYTNLIPGKTYVMTGKLVVKKDYKEGEEIEFVTDASGKVIEVSVEFVPEKADGTVDVEFVVDASKYAGKKLVAFEKLTYEGIELTTHTDIEDKEQTIVVSLILHVQIAKADKDNIAYYLKDAEITIFYAEKGEDGELLKDADGNIIYTVVKDVNGNDCIALTDENGNVDFSFYWDETKVYFAKETKAPAGYQICDTYFELTPDENRESLGTCLIKINILDAIIIIPPKTGDDMPLGIITVIAVLAVIGIIGSAFFLVKRNKKTTTEPDENPITNSTNDSDDA